MWEGGHYPSNGERWLLQLPMPHWPWRCIGPLCGPVIHGLSVAEDARARRRPRVFRGSAAAGSSGQLLHRLEFSRAAPACGSLHSAHVLSWPLVAGPNTVLNLLGSAPRPNMV